MIVDMKSTGHYTVACLTRSLRHAFFIQAYHLYLEMKAPPIYSYDSYAFRN